MSYVIEAKPMPATSMDTKEIAGVTGKEHKHVLRDTRVMLVTLFAGEQVDSVIPESKANQRAQYIRDNVDELFKVVFEDGPERDHQKNQGFTLHRDSRNYLASIDLDRSLTLTLVSGYDIRLRKRIVDRLDELERGAALPATGLSAALADPATLRAALLGYTEKVVELQTEVAVLAPKAAALEQISAGKESLTMTQAAKVLGLKLDELSTFMKQKGWIYRQNGSWVAYEKHLRNGDLKYKEAKYTDEETAQEVRRPYCHILPKGLTKLATLMNGEKEAA